MTRQLALFSLVFSMVFSMCQLVFATEVDPCAQPGSTYHATCWVYRQDGTKKGDCGEKYCKEGASDGECDKSPIRCKSGLEWVPCQHCNLSI